MLITDNTRYLNIPVSSKAKLQKLCFYEKGTLILDLDVNLDFDCPQYFFPYDVGQFIGRDIDIDNSEKLSFSDKKPLPPTLPYRPSFHFSADYGFVNDPNGLIFYEGRYHLFFQHNPVGISGTNMHWGHAVSDDLLCWHQLPEAIMPDNMGTVWSGSAIVDSKNLLSLNTDEHEALLLFYTAAGDLNLTSAGKKFCQCIAYSTDGGYSFKKYENNPAVPHIFSQNRDPKVVYDSKSDMYFMALHLKTGFLLADKSKTLRFEGTSAEKIRISTI